MRDAELGGVELGDTDVAVLELVDRRRGRDGELVEPVVTEEHQRPLDPERRQRAHDPLGHHRIRHPDGAAGRAGRVGERTQEVERRGRAQLAAHRCGEAHRRVEALGEAEPDADLAHAAGHALGPEVDHHTERLEHVDRPALRRRGTAAVLGDPRARCGGDDRGHGRDVHRAGAVAAGTTGVDQWDVEIGEVDPLGEIEHGAHQGRELGGGLALGAEADGERGDLRVGRVAREDLRHRLLDEVVGKVVAPEQVPDDIGPQRCIHPPDATGATVHEARTGPLEFVRELRRSGGDGGRVAGVRVRRVRPRRPASPGR